IAGEEVECKHVPPDVEDYKRGEEGRPARQSCRLKLLALQVPNSFAPMRVRPGASARRSYNIQYLTLQNLQRVAAMPQYRFCDRKSRRRAHTTEVSLGYVFLTRLSHLGMLHLFLQAGSYLSDSLGRRIYRKELLLTTSWPSSEQLRLPALLAHNLPSQRKAGDDKWLYSGCAETSAPLLVKRIHVSAFRDTCPNNRNCLALFVR
ncbi:hypothetical protein DFH11DRAFT_1606558, partial [Phellopilus nigrolimitatus]